jgi:S-adenosylmethionine decarboxylase
MPPRPTALKPQGPPPAPPQAAGRHLLADLHGVRAALLTDQPGLTALLRRALDLAGFHVLDARGHTFSGGGGGVTVMMLLSESHATIHTYPENGYAALDVFSCGSARPEDALQVVLDALSPGEVRSAVHRRGGDRS